VKLYSHQCTNVGQAIDEIVQVVDVISEVPGHRVDIHDFPFIAGTDSCHLRDYTVNRTEDTHTENEVKYSSLASEEVHRSFRTRLRGDSVGNRHFAAFPRAFMENAGAIFVQERSQ
jgi:hypothetical protein